MVLEESVRQLCRKIASGDSEAFSRLYRQQFDGMYGEARRVTRRDEAFCLDVVQDAMMKVIRSIPVLDDEPSLGSWLRIVVRSCAYDRLKAEIRRLKREERAADSRRTASDDGDERRIAEDRLAWLRSELSSLDPEQAALIGFKYRLGWTFARIGQLTGLSGSAADGRISRAVARLAARAKERFDE